MKPGIVIAWMCILGLFSGAVYGFRTNAVRATETKERVAAFYVTHHCQPEGYIATRHEPVRTYRCDNGLFIAEDMR